MKTQIRSLFTLICAASAILLITGSPAHAGYIVTLHQVGSNVVATGSGPIDLTGLTGDGSFNAITSPNISGDPASVTMGPAGAHASTYTGSVPFSGPLTIGSGLGTNASFGSGDPVQIINPLFAVIAVPVGYVSGTVLTSGATYSGQTFATLGVTPGTYEWTWGDGANQNFTLKVVTAGVPDVGSTFGLLFLSSAALFGARHFRFRQPA